MTLYRLFPVLSLLLTLALPAWADGLLEKFLPDNPASALVEGADAYGAQREDLPIVPVLKDGEEIGYAFVTSDFANRSTPSSPSTRARKSSGSNWSNTLNPSFWSVFRTKRSRPSPDRSSAWIWWQPPPGPSMI